MSADDIKRIRRAQELLTVDVRHAYQEDWPGCGYSHKAVLNTLSDVAWLADELEASEGRAAAAEARADELEQAVRDSLRHMAPCPICKTTADQCCSQFCSAGCGMRADFRYVHHQRAALGTPEPQEQDNPRCESSPDGHQCSRPRGHRGDHECRCGKAWLPSAAAVLEPTEAPK